MGHRRGRRRQQAIVCTPGAVDTTAVAPRQYGRRAQAARGATTVAHAHYGHQTARVCSDTTYVFPSCPWVAHKAHTMYSSPCLCLSWTLPLCSTSSKQPSVPLYGSPPCCFVVCPSGVWGFYWKVAIIMKILLSHHFHLLLFRMMISCYVVWWSQALEMVSGQYTCSVFPKQALEMVSGQYTCSVFPKQMLEMVSGQYTCSVFLKQVLEMSQASTLAVSSLSRRWRWSQTSTLAVSSLSRCWRWSQASTLAVSSLSRCWRCLRPVHLQYLP